LQGRRLKNYSSISRSEGSGCEAGLSPQALGLFVRQTGLLLGDGSGLLGRHGCLALLLLWTGGRLVGQLDLRGRQHLHCLFNEKSEKERVSYSSVSAQSFVLLLL